MSKITLGFPNATCAHCARLVTRSLQKLDGVLAVEVDSFMQQVTVEFDPQRVTLDSIRSLMDKSGYSTTVVAASLKAA